jgi:hypothetical protein
VTLTEWTNVQGKKLSTEWEKVNSKQDYLLKIKNTISDKERNYHLLLKHYESISALRLRNFRNQVLYRN